MGSDSKEQGAGDLWDLTIEDLFSSSDAAASDLHAAVPGPYTLDLCTSAEPATELAPCLRDFEQLQAYQVTDWQDDNLVFRLRLGPIDSELEADAILSIVRRDYPEATALPLGEDDRRTLELVATAAPRGGSKPPPGAVDTAANGVADPLPAMPTPSAVQAAPASTHRGSPTGAHAEDPAAAFRDLAAALLTPELLAPAATPVRSNATAAKGTAATSVPPVLTTAIAGRHARRASTAPQRDAASRPSPDAPPPLLPIEAAARPARPHAEQHRSTSEAIPAPASEAAPRAPVPPAAEAHHAARPAADATTPPLAKAAPATTPQAERPSRPAAPGEFVPGAHPASPAEVVPVVPFVRAVEPPRVALRPPLDKVERGASHTTSARPQAAALVDRGIAASASPAGEPSGRAAAAAPVPVPPAVRDARPAPTFELELLPDDLDRAIGRAATVPVAVPSAPAVAPPAAREPAPATPTPTSKPVVEMAKPPAPRATPHATPAPPPAPAAGPAVHVTAAARSQPAVSVVRPPAAPTVAAPPRTMMPERARAAAPPAARPAVAVARTPPPAATPATRSAAAAPAVVARPGSASPAAPTAAPPPGPPPIDSTQTLRALVVSDDAEEETEKLLVIQLMLSEREIAPDSVPNLAIFNEYRLYCAVGYEQGRVMHALRLGFFNDAGPAEAVAGYLRAYFDSPVVTRVSAEERERFATRRIAARKDSGDTGLHAAIELSSAPSAPSTSLADLKARARAGHAAKPASGRTRR